MSGDAFMCAVHIGAGFHSPTNTSAYKAALRRSLSAAFAVLTADGSATEATRAAIQVLEVVFIIFIFIFNFVFYYLIYDSFMFIFFTCLGSRTIKSQTRGLEVISHTTDASSAMHALWMELRAIQALLVRCRVLMISSMHFSISFILSNSDSNIHRPISFHDR